MTIDDIEDMMLLFERTQRTSASEKYVILSINKEKSVDYSEHTEFGLISLQYVNPSRSRDYVDVWVLLKEECTVDTLNYIETCIEVRLIDDAGGARDREVHFNIYNADLIRSSKAGGLSSEKLVPRIASDVKKTNEEIENLHDNFSDQLDDVIQAQYEEMRNLIDTADEEKRKAIQNKMKVGLERGLPTVLYEIGSETES